MNSKSYSVMKFGGSCLRSAADMAEAARIISLYRNPVVITSAMTGVTQSLLEICEEKGSAGRMERLRELERRHREALSLIRDREVHREAEKDISAKFTQLSNEASFRSGLCEDASRAHIMSFGERLAAVILKWYTRDASLSASDVGADEVLFSRDDDLLNATVDEDYSQGAIRNRIGMHASRGEIPIITGFFCRSRSGRTALLGRNSSDYTAAIVAYAMPDCELIFWKDVPGFMTGDPKLVKESSVIRVLSYEQAEQYISTGARILHSKVISLAKTRNVPIRVKNFRDSGADGTLIPGAYPSAELS